MSALERLAELRLQLAKQEREPQSYTTSAQIRFLLRTIREVEAEIAGEPAAVPPRHMTRIDVSDHGTDGITLDEEAMS